MSGKAVDRESDHHQSSALVNLLQHIPGQLDIIGVAQHIILSSLVPPSVPVIHPQSRRHRRNTCFGFALTRPTMQQQTTTVAHNALPPPSSTTVARSSRISAHSHIKGLGLTQDGYATSDAAGFIGQANAREVRSFPRPSRPG